MIRRKNGNVPPLYRFSPAAAALCGLAAGILIKLFLFDILVVSGTSMHPRFSEQDVIVISKTAYGLVQPFGIELLVRWNEPAVDDIVVYIYRSKTVIKRCVATAGHRLEFSTDSGYSLLVNGRKIPLTEPQYQKIKHSTAVPDGMILAIGDNYRESVDSRDYGFVSVNNILGKVLCR